MRTTTKEKVDHSFSKHHHTCDRCGDPCGPDEKTTSAYQVCKVEIEMRDGVKIDMSINPPIGLNLTNIKNVKFESEEGDQYPEGGDTEVTVIGIEDDK